ncbi:sulfatase maturation enzyme AslB (radical SAM superfamily) [Kitasatospora sp. GP30]|uniref:radical SAM protein n=1 Tax=Kitasatospora sp. GP30 TaxID=3035084 RepID=UPI000C7035D8|nr:radical SAM protein [Kitasatospora sp. GP30]MDH6144139.1 sulfatase maturation enzyme AslB (radical SAM superfamily) [Kitasatospora sp. GP30]
MIRTFAAAAINGTMVVHDPAVGTNHLPPQPLPSGRIALDEHQVAAWPEAQPGQLTPKAPLSMCWSPIVRCNLACPHCLDDKSVRESSAEERQQLAGHITASGVLGVDLSGGEPLLLRDLPDLAQAIRAGERAVVSCTTNGWHLARRAQELAPALDAIRVSLDGATAATHDTWRGTDSHSRAIDGTQAAVAAGLRVQFQMVLMRSTYHEAQALLDLASQLGVGGVTFLQLLPIGEGQAIADDQMLTDEQARAAVYSLTVPDGVRVRLRTRGSADGFTVLRADGYAWRNTGGATSITAFLPVNGPEDLHLPTAASAS